MTTSAVSLRRVWGLVNALQQEFRGTNLGTMVGVNRRGAVRFKCYDLVKWIRNDEIMNHQVSNAHDLSATGMRFSTNEFLPPETLLRIIINLAEAGKEIAVIAKVIWSRSAATGNYQAGVRFVQIAEEDQNLIRSLAYWCMPVPYYN